MNKDYYEYARLNMPHKVPQYADFMSDYNVRIISEDVANLVKESFPNDPLFIVNERSIRGAMWEVFSTNLQHTQVMIQMTINILAQQVILEKEAQDTSHLNPHILDTPELFGLHSYNPTIMRFNEKKNRPLHFSGFFY